MSLFTDLLADLEAEKQFLVELEPWDPVGAATVPLYFSSHGFTTAPGDTPASTFYEPRLKTAPVYERSLFSSGKLSGRSVPAQVTLSLINNDGALDDLYNLSFGGRAIRVYAGGPDFGYSDYGLILDNVVQDISYNDDGSEVTITVRDAAVSLDVDIPDTRYGPTRPEGLRNQIVPLAIGIVRYVSPVYTGLDGVSRHTFSVGDNFTTTFLSVRDRGVPLTVVASGPTAGQYIVDLSGAIITLGGSFVGPITAEVVGVPYFTASVTGSLSISTGSRTFNIGSNIGRMKVGMRVQVRSHGSPGTAWMSGFITSYSNPNLVVDVQGTSGAGTFSDWEVQPVATAAEAMRQVAQIAGFTSFDDSSIDALNASLPGPVGYWVKSGENALNLLDAIANGSGCYWGINVAGDFEVGQLDVPGSPIASFDDVSILSIQRNDTEDPRYRFDVKYQRNWTPLDDSDIAGSLSADTRIVLRTEWPTVYSEDTSIKDDYLLSEKAEIETVFDVEADAQDESDRQLAFFGVKRDYFKVRVKAPLFTIAPNDTVEIVSSRYGLTGGKSFRVVDISEFWNPYEIEMGLWG